MPATTDARRAELAGFLRTRRERITPEDVGLPLGSRRRTPGLRREEVAQLAGVGVTWYTWLEQGRRINASTQVLHAIANTLRMDTQERAHLLRLAGATATPGSRPAPLPDGIEAILDRLDPYPAFVLSERFDILAHNRAYGLVFGDIDTLDPEDRNHLWLFFTHPSWRGNCMNRGPASRHLVNNLRAAMSTHLDDPIWTSLIGRLRRASPEFDGLWKHYDVTSPALPAKGFHSPYGDVRVHGTRLTVGLDGLNHLIVYTPSDAESRSRLERLCAEG
ncbi:helix-turn-helix transcriptional regulator [Micromonospora okii]|uniref:helix-turn-helix transcriptional regulator n=1 Tax=Micromonospora okii TaxID=1182970 RepID=UPI001E48D210|nr:helix-turn-helix transcriptional regulator [Micromonospora okii]